MSTYMILAPDPEAVADLLVHQILCLSGQICMCTGLLGTKGLRVDTTASLAEVLVVLRDYEESVMIHEGSLFWEIRQGRLASITRGVVR